MKINPHLITKEIDETYRYAKKEYKVRPENIDVCKTTGKIQYMKKWSWRSEQIDWSGIKNKQKQDAEIFGLKGLINYKPGRRKDGIELMNRAVNKSFLDEDLLQEMTGLAKNE